MTILLAGAAALLAAAAPESASRANPPAPPAAPRAEQSEKGKESKNKKEEFDFAQILTMFDKMFPQQPDPAPGRLALSRVTANGLFPDGTYGRMMDGMMSGMVDRVLDMSEADFGGKATDGKEPGKATLRQQLAKEDPHFQERMRITQRVIGEEMAKLAVVIEPRMREGLARAMARRFDERQLADINAFLATASGRAYGSQSMAMWLDGDVMRSIMTSVPDMIIALPGAMKRLESETAHLPKPKKEKKQGAVKEVTLEEPGDEPEKAPAED